MDSSIVFVVLVTIAVPGYLHMITRWELRALEEEATRQRALQEHMNRISRRVPRA